MNFLQQLGHSDPHLSCGLFHFGLDFLIGVSWRQNEFLIFAWRNYEETILLQQVAAIISYMATFIQFDVVAFSIAKLAASSNSSRTP